MLLVLIAFALPGLPRRRGDRLDGIGTGSRAGWFGDGGWGGGDCSSGGGDFGGGGGGAGDGGGC